MVAQAPIGLTYYAVENLDNPANVIRGTATSQGLVFDRLILAPTTRYRLWILQASTLRVGDVSFTSPQSGNAFQVPAIVLRETSSPDSDGDGLHDLGEFIVNTNARDTDSDDDGIWDGAEVQQGLNPNDNRIVNTGLVTSGETPGTAVDVCAFNDIAIVADSDRGISVFNVFNGMNPVAIAQVDTPGNAIAVACSGNLIAVADSGAGLAVIDIADPPAARIIQQVSLGASAMCVASAGEIAYVGLASGQIVTVDLATGALLGTLSLGGAAVQDLALAGDNLYALVEGRLYVLAYLKGELKVVGSVASPGSVNSAHGRMRLFVGGNIAYPVHTQGYNTIDVSNPVLPQLITSAPTTQFGWKQIVLNGSGRGIATVGTAPGLDPSQVVEVYDVRNPAVNNAFLDRFSFPAAARAVSIYNGLAYVAAHTAGIQVLNYQSYDALGIPPTVSLTTSFATGVAEEGKLMRVTASVTDDVQVRNVEFYTDGVKVATDGNFPFEHRFITPLLASGKTFFTLRARASDTGGNATWTDEVLVTLVEDATRPEVVKVIPGRDSLTVPVTDLLVTFDEPINPATLANGGFQLFALAADGSETPVAVPGIAYREQVNTAVLSVPEPLAPRRYRAVVSPPLSDLAGNALASPYEWRFQVYSAFDGDDDKVPDDLEPLLGLDPKLADSDNDGIPDGAEDFDGDRLSNAGEFVLGTNPTKPDSDGDGVADGDEDTDRDGLADGPEITARTDPFNYDTDGDRFTDKDEVDYRSDPLDPASVPIRNFVTTTVFNATTPGFFERNLAVVQVVTVVNAAAPEAISGTTLGRPVTVDNVPAPPPAPANREGRGDFKKTASEEK